MAAALALAMCSSMLLTSCGGKSKGAGQGKEIEEMLEDTYGGRFTLTDTVAYRPGISSAEGVEKLCLGNSLYLLLELPFRAWGKEELRQVNNFACVLGITPILAHYERYRTLQSRECYNR